MDQEQDRPWRLAGHGCADPFAEQVKLHVALVGPIFMAPYVHGSAMCCWSLRVRRRDPRGETGTYAEAGPFYDRTACNRMLRHDVFLGPALLSGDYARIADRRSNGHKAIEGMGQKGPMGPSAALAPARDIC